MLTFTTRLTPRFSETDALGHINNAAIAAWFEVARMELLSQAVPVASGDITPWVLASVKLDYIAETFYGSEVVFRYDSVDMGNSSVTINCGLYQDDRHCVQGVSTLVHLNPETRSSAPLPDRLRSQLLAMQSESEQA